MLSFFILFFSLSGQNITLCSGVPTHYDLSWHYTNGPESSTYFSYTFFVENDGGSYRNTVNADIESNRDISYQIVASNFDGVSQPVSRTISE